MGNQTSRTGWKFKSDTERSTYRWIIHFQNKNIIMGYSRKAGKEEIKDKIRLLKRKIIMLTKSKNNYFDEKNVKFIEFYQRTGLDEYENHLFTLYPTEYRLGNNKLFNACEPMINFIKMVYNLIAVGNIGQLSYEVVGYSKIKEQDIFKVSLDRFRNAAELQKYSQDLIIEGYPKGQVEHYQRQIMELFARSGGNNNQLHQNSAVGR